MKIEITKETVLNLFKESDADYIWDEFCTDSTFYLDFMFQHILKSKGYNRGELQIDQMIFYENKPWVVVEVTPSAAKIQSLNDDETLRISRNSQVKLL